MPSALPDGEPVPAGGPLADRPPFTAGRGLSVYLHVPFCTTRCGYCDFNTYTADELGPGASRTDYIDAALRELSLAREVLGDARPVQSLFVGGGTPTLLPPDDLVRFVRRVDEWFGLAPDAEVTTESNPDSVDAAALAALRDGGFTRVSFGMQSASPSVLQVLDRRHTPGRAQQAVADARAAGFGSINLDLIYGTPGESDHEWRDSLAAVIDAGVDHISAYSLIVEDGTRLAARIARGELDMVDDDVLADRYEIADAMLESAGLRWYEVSNWALPGHECRHNLAYWRSDDWIGIGPGAHSHVDGVRWWNVKHPAAYARGLRDGGWPAAGREVLDTDQRTAEDLMLRVRLVDGVPIDGADDPLVSDLRELVAEGLAQPEPARDGHLRLTLRGRLMADAVARRLLDTVEEAAAP